MQVSSKLLLQSINKYLAVFKVQGKLLLEVSSKSSEDLIMTLKTIPNKLQELSLKTLYLNMLSKNPISWKSNLSSK